MGKIHRRVIEPKRGPRFLNPRAVVIMKITVACIFLFISAFFFLANIDVFVDDILSWRAGLPIIFLLGIVVICVYISFLVNRIGDGTIFRAERLDLLFKLVFSIVIIYIPVRSIFMEPYMNLPTPLVVFAIVTGLANWLIPPVIINDSEEF